MSDRRDVLANDLAESLNSKIKGQKVAFFLDGTDHTPTDIDDFISTGSALFRSVDIESSQWWNCCGKNNRD